MKKSVERFSLLGKILLLTISCILSLNFCHASFNDPSGDDFNLFLKKYHNSIEKTKGYSKLLFAMQKGSRDIAAKFIEMGENVNLSLKSTPTPFLLAIEKEDLELVKLMLNNGADVNLKWFFKPYSKHVSPLFLSVSLNKNTHILETLCQHGAHLCDSDQWERDYSSLGYAASQADWDKFQILSQYFDSEDLIKIDMSGTNLLQIWVNAPRTKEILENYAKIVLYLIKIGAQIETPQKSALTYAIYIGNINIINFYISNGSDINFVSSNSINYEIPIIAAINFSRDTAHGGNMNPLNILLENDVKIDFATELDHNKQYAGYSPLGYCMTFDAIPAAEALIIHGANVDFVDGLGNTALIRAIKAKNIKGVELLLTAGADPLKPDQRGQTPIELAHKCNTPNIFDLLIKHESEIYIKTKVK